MNRLLPFILFSVSFLHAMEKTEIDANWERIEKLYNNARTRNDIASVLFGGQILINLTLPWSIGAATKLPRSNFNGQDPTIVQQNNARADQDRFKISHSYVLFNLLTMGIPIALISPVSSDYLADAYADRDNIKKCAANAFMGTGLAINSLLISAGGSRNLSSNSSVKNTLNIVSTGATAMETFKHVRQAYNLWGKDNAEALKHIGYAGLFTTFGVMPFVLDQYQKKVTQ